jgi:hypothetical protein
MLPYQDVSTPFKRAVALAQERMRTSIVLQPGEVDAVCEALLGADQLVRFLDQYVQIVPATKLTDALQDALTLLVHMGQRKAPSVKTDLPTDR